MSRNAVICLVVACGLLAASCATGTGGASAPEPEEFVTHPLWVRLPQAEDMERLYPTKANGRPGLTAVDCTIHPTGRLAACELVSEIPGGMGFGDSTLELAKLFRMKTVDRDGHPVAGRKLHLPVRWIIPD